MFLKIYSCQSSFTKPQVNWWRLQWSKRPWDINCKEHCQRSQWNQIRWLWISISYYFSGRKHIKFYRFYWGWKIDWITNSYLLNLVNCIRTKEKKYQVDLFIPLMRCKDEGTRVFKIFVCLKQRILDLKY